MSVVGLSVALAFSSFAAADDGWVPLFDGKTLNGWKVVGGENKFSVKDGVIRGEGVPSDCGINTFLVTEKEYANFDFKVEFLIESGNSGVQFRSATREKYDPAWDWNPFKEGLHKVFGYQAEITPDGSNTGRIYDEERRGYRNGIVFLDTGTPQERAEVAKASFKKGDWNEMRVRCEGTHIQTWLNGNPVADLADDFDGKGFIGLQMHLQRPPKDGEAFVPGVAKFRNIRIRELPVADPQAFPRATPESQGIRSEAVMNLIGRLQAEGDMVHSYMLIRHGKVVAEGWWAPYDAETRHALYSVSKSFVSMGIGFAVEDRLMSMNDRVNAFFPDQVLADQDALAREIRVRDLMAMASGQTNDASKAMFAAPAGGQAKAFYATRMAEPPGRRFRYMNGNTAMLAQIHRRVTGADDLVEYLKPRLFDALGIDDFSWARQPDGTVLGCSGFELRTEDLAKVAQLLLRNGCWNGRRVLPLWWVKQATSCQTPYGDVLDPVLAYHMGRTAKPANEKEPNDWEVGYGYQLWMGRHETFRLCGAFGQIAIIMPSEDMVFVSHAGGNGANALSVNAFYDAILPGLSKEPLPENPSALKALRERSAALSITLPEGAGAPSAHAVEVAARGCAAGENVFGLKSVKYNVEARLLELKNGIGKQQIEGGANGVWKKGHAVMENDSTSTLDRMRGGWQPLGACGGWKDGSTFVARIAFTRSPFILDFTLDCSGEEMRVSCDCKSGKRYQFGSEGK